MTKSTIVLVIILVGMAGAYMYGWTDMFQPNTFQILAQVRPTTGNPRGGLGRGRAGGGGGGGTGNVTLTGTTPTYPVTFSFDHNVRITEIKVVPADEAAKSRFPHALWHLISDTKSSPVKALVYGQYIRGMKPKTPRADPEPLLPDVRYRLLITAGKASAQIDFKTVAVPGSEAPPEPDQP
jgi:hypothetical protein